jgi:uncharacterized protein DUF2786
MEQISKNERAKRLIRELLAKTVENGATESEALAAMAKANELMLQYDISLEDAKQVRDETYGVLKRMYGKGSFRRRTWHEAIDLAVPIACFTGTRVWRTSCEGAIHYFGRKQDTELAHYILDLCINCCETEWQALRRTHTIINNAHLSLGVDTSIKGRKSFLRGMINRLDQRLWELADERKAALRQTVTSNALVVLKDQIVAEKFDTYQETTGLRLKKSTTVRRSYSHGSKNYAEGTKAGDRVSLSSGIGPTSKPSGLLD